MIKINLLPPELRKRTTSINPMMVVPALEIAACLAILAFGAYVAYEKIPAANAIADAKTAELNDKTAQAAAIQAEDEQIAAFQATQATLHDMLGRKVYWAHTLDDFVNLLASNFPGGFTVRCLNLSISPSAAAETSRHATTMAFSFRGQFQLVGDEGKAGEYIKDMFKQIGNSAFWKTHHFTGKPEDTYFGDHPTVDPAIGKVVIPFNLTFERVHTVPTPAPKAGG